jgi:hypothetical protein
MDPIPPQENFKEAVKNDNSQFHTLRLYSKATADSFYELKQLKTASAKELTAVYQNVYEQLKKFKIIINERLITMDGNYVIPAYAGLQRWHIFTLALTTNGFSPFVDQHAFNEVMQKYQSDSELQQIVYKCSEIVNELW